MEGKKISFSFIKTKKVDKPVVEEQRDYIECVEEKAIKVVGGEIVQEIKPLIIPMKPNTLITAEKLKEIALKVEKDLDEPEPDSKPMLVDETPPENETLDQMAVRELLQDSKKEIKVESSALTVPIPAKPVMDGQKESTLDDYDAVPVQDFGMAMLRGMGWAPGNEQSKYKQPQLRPKGLGLGADKVVKDNQKKNVSNNKEEELTIVKNSYVKIVTGKYSGFYGKVVSLDEDNGRVMVDIAMKKETVSLGEFMMQPVTKSEYDKESKVINADSFEEYKKNEKSHSSKHESLKVSEREPSSSLTSSDPNRKDRNREDNSRREYDESNGKNRDKIQRTRRDSSSEDRSRRRNKKYSSNDSLSSVESENRRKHKSKSRKKRYSSKSDSSDTEKDRKKEKKRDIDKKRKGKKKKRDRDRSPNYRKHRK